MSSIARLTEYLQVKNVKKNDFTQLVGLSKGYLNNVKDLGADKIASILPHFPDLSVEWLITGEGSMIKNENTKPSLTYQTSRKSQLKESQAIPLYDIEATAGLVPLFSDGNHSNPVDHIIIPHLPKCDGAIKVTGDSMYPLLKAGDIIMYKQVPDIENGIFWGEVYLISVDNGGDEYVTVKYIQKSEKEGYVTLVSQNKHHQDKEVKLKNIKALALVKASVRMNSMS